MTAHKLGQLKTGTAGGMVAINDTALAVTDARGPGIPLVGLDAAARVLTGSTMDDAALTPRVPSDGKAKSVRALLDRLDEHSIEVEEFSVHTPDLGEVFLALTGHASTEENAR